LVNHNLRELRQEGVLQADCLPKVRGAPDQPPQHVVAATVSLLNAVRDQKRYRPAMIGNRVVSGKVLLVMLAPLAGELHQPVEQGRKEIRLVITLYALKNRRETLQPHARVN